MSDQRVLVVGTTPDYVAHIHVRYPRRALFLTDTAQRAGEARETPDDLREVVTNLSEKGGVLNALGTYLRANNLSLSGVTCYDCEWLNLTAELAIHFRLKDQKT